MSLGNLMKKELNERFLLICKDLIIYKSIEESHNKIKDFDIDRLSTKDRNKLLLDLIGSSKTEQPIKRSDNVNCPEKNTETIDNMEDIHAHLLKELTDNGFEPTEDELSEDEPLEDENEIDYANIDEFEEVEVSDIENIDDLMEKECEENPEELEDVLSLMDEVHDDEIEQLRQHMAIRRETLLTNETTENEPILDKPILEESTENETDNTKDESKNKEPPTINAFLRMTKREADQKKYELFKEAEVMVQKMYPDKDVSELQEEINEEALRLIEEFAKQ